MKRIDWSTLDERQRDEALVRPARESDATVRTTVASIMADVRDRGDAAVRDATRRFDGIDVDDAEVDAEEFREAAASIDASLRGALEQAAARIEAFHREGALRPYAVETASGVVCARLVRPIDRVGLYIPAGTAPLPTTVLMLGIPARIAGCSEVILCTPPRANGRADAAVLAAAECCGIRRVFKIGGAQAIAAMASGTETVPRCDKLFGPGNAWVTEAKRQVFLADVAVDLPAGPSELLVVADASAKPKFVAADLLSQAEHGADSQVVLVADDETLLDAVEREIDRQLRTLPREATARASLSHARLIRVDAIEVALEIANAYAPEHLILAIREPRCWLDRVRAAGSVFLGDWTPEALGDYCSGTNHVLPTGGAARAFSGVGVASFQKTISVQAASPTGLAAIGDCAISLAGAEGLAAHARAISTRLDALRDTVSA
ncbi:MAG TPA: histidinol dehydrogenase [Rhodanobacteraceae bacterium]|nr:histidinol dehydrogenase [Rhodanobacteraceae bacterium]